MVRVRELIKDMGNVELFEYLNSVDGHYSDYSSLYIYLSEHPPMHDYYRMMFKDIDLNCKLFLDLGPGVGDSLDVARDMGAKTYFVDRDIFIGKYCENKGHGRIHLDFFKFPIPVIGRFDLVLSRGSFNVDMMNRDFPIGDLIRWLVQIGNHIIVLPTWDKGEVIENNDYTCVGEHMERYLESKVHKTFLAFGFDQKVTECNDRLRFPITYEYSSPL